MTSAINEERRLGWLLPIAAATLLAAGADGVHAMSVTLCAEPYTITLPGEAAQVPMWGYRQVADASACSATSALRASAAAPVITMPAGDSSLAVTLVNRLAVPTSVVIAGQALPADGGAAVMAEDLIGASCDPATMAMPARMACRVRSFTGETDAGAQRTYTFTNLRPGSFLLQSGTHPQAQVQMGLVALLKQDAAPLDLTARRLYGAAATDANPSFDVDATALLSEVDVAQHNRIQSTLGTDGQQAQWKTGGSTLDYAPRHFLINGRPFDGSNVAATDIGVNAPNGARVVLRLANAGLQSRSLMLTNGTWRVLTEDGYPYAAPREQATVLLPAGKTSDVAMVAVNNGAVGSTATMGAVFDRRGGAAGGQVARLAVTNAASVNHPPVVSAGPDQQLVYLGAPLSATLAGTASDDGANAPLQLSWTASGPAAVTLSTPGALSTGATFTATGNYTLRLAAFDGEFTTVDEAIVRVVPPQADLSITKTNGATSVGQGLTTTYTITVSNAGPTAVSGATVLDTLPAGVASATWTCAPAVSCGAASGSGDINTTVSLGVGGSATFTLNATLSATASGSLVNTASVSVPAGASDPNPANNTATDTDTILPAPPAVLPLDNFDRANANTLGGSWSQVVAFGQSAIRVNTNQASDVLVAGAAYWSGSDLAAQPRQAAAFTVANATVNGDALILRASGGVSAAVPANFIRVRYNAGQVAVQTTSNGGISFASLGSPFTTTLANGDRLVAQANGDGSVQVWKTTGANWTYLGQTPASTFTAGGRVGMQLPAGARVDNFEGVTLP